MTGTTHRAKKPAAIGIFAKAPVPGKTKTRLASHIGEVAAASLHEAFLSDTIAAMQRLAPCVLFTAGNGQHPFFSQMDIPCEAQVEGDLGTKMSAAIASLHRHHERAILVGSDAPTLPLGYVQQAITTPAELAFGPSDDGGFYLVMAKGQPDFAQIQWSAPTTLAETLTRNPGATLLPRWFDVDRYDDLLRLADDCDLAVAPATARWLRRHRPTWQQASAE